MSDSPPLNVLAGIEARQDELLAQLDELNQRIEQTLARCTPRADERPSATDSVVARPPGLTH